MPMPWRLLGFKELGLMMFQYIPAQRLDCNTVSLSAPLSSFVVSVLTSFLTMQFTVGLCCCCCQAMGMTGLGRMSVLLYIAAFIFWFDAPLSNLTWVIMDVFTGAATTYFWWTGVKREPRREKPHDTQAGTNLSPPLCARNEGLVPDSNSTTFCQSTCPNLSPERNTHFATHRNNILPRIPPGPGEQALIARSPRANPGSLDPHLCCPQRQYVPPVV